MSVSDDRSRAALVWESLEEMSVGLLFSNWTACRYRDCGCPLYVQWRREAGLLKRYCSNNESVKGCLMYRILELCEESL